MRDCKYDFEEYSMCPCGIPPEGNWVGAYLKSSNLLGLQPSGFPRPEHLSHLLYQGLSQTILKSELFHTRTKARQLKETFPARMILRIRAGRVLAEHSETSTVEVPVRKGRFRTCTVLWSSGHKSQRLLSARNGAPVTEKPNFHFISS